MPETKPAAWAGAAVGATQPQPHEAAKIDITGFKPLVAVEFTRGDAKGRPFAVSRTVEAKFDVRGFTPKGLDEKACKAAIAEAKLVHFLDLDAKDADVVFAACGAELKAFLARGGALILSRTPTGPAAQAFLKEVDVFDPNAKTEKCVGDNNGTWCGPDGHPYLTACHKSSGRKDAPGEQFWVWSDICNTCQGQCAFLEWDKARQTALFRPVNDGEGKAFVILQENVCGKGRVLFNRNYRIFTDFYEGKRAGDNFLTYLTGTLVTEHAKKATAYNGGPGKPVEEY